MKIVTCTHLVNSYNFRLSSSELKQDIYHVISDCCLIKRQCSSTRNKNKDKLFVIKIERTILFYSLLHLLVINLLHHRLHLLDQHLHLFVLACGVGQVLEINHFTHANGPLVAVGKLIEGRCGF